MLEKSEPLSRTARRGSCAGNEGRTVGLVFDIRQAGNRGSSDKYDSAELVQRGIHRFPQSLPAKVGAVGRQCVEPWPVDEHKSMVFTVPPHIWQVSMAILIHLQTFRRVDARTASCRQLPVSGLIYSSMLTSGSRPEAVL